MTNGDFAELRAAIGRRHWVFRCTVKTLAVFSGSSLLLLSQGARTRSAIIAGLLAAATYILGGLEITLKNNIRKCPHPPTGNGT